VYLNVSTSTNIQYKRSHSNTQYKPSNSRHNTSTNIQYECSHSRHNTSNNIQYECSHLNTQYKHSHSRHNTCTITQYKHSHSTHNTRTQTILNTNTQTLQAITYKTNTHLVTHNMNTRIQHYHNYNILNSMKLLYTHSKSELATLFLHPRCYRPVINLPMSE